MTDSKNFFGPPLPPGFKQVHSDLKGEDFGEPQSSKHNVIGPSLPSGFIKHDSDKSSDSEPEAHVASSTSNDSSKNGTTSSLIGPGVSGSRKTESNNVVAGPTFPPGFKQSFEPSNSDSDSNSETDIIGPLPSMAIEKETVMDVSQEIERRSKKMKNKLEGNDDLKNKVPARETWMIELPPDVGKQFGLGPRSFSNQTTSSKGQDRSVWTDTPKDKAQKLQEGKSSSKPLLPEPQVLAQVTKDKKLSKQLKEYNKSKRSKTLLEIHQKKMKKKKKKKDKREERKPFDRDTDLQVNCIDASKTKGIIDKARFLNSRFAPGASHFL
ncbi:GPALPP motifs-containing protein 1-like [Limulus polyphemus]|uniref:GPALPP motifs-containing protein 1-like n=1 Tax=Limulus polyphemus TaxID=6850 RepID=A0ABM1C5V9_LIMPO|nr:GPALPP motifs-containing protein 1-like [Limulus polyphemus]XP_013794763.1 GPALPP motifs-containing protein 1-like [Limulus polyphemus]XP_013794764.1 GPALPP motifs-containing protein 1-like [Limulus polyphemus]XP_022238101.1 GPALPP motifs-containing protein 1-like [Limulus polyphemus]XP_022238102.1 GPALPP motifs-containing protein 1-like [Limulus polyphemus]